MYAWNQESAAFAIVCSSSFAAVDDGGQNGSSAGPVEGTNQRTAISHSCCFPSKPRRQKYRVRTGNRAGAGQEWFKRTTDLRRPRILAAGFFELVAGFSDEFPGDPVKVRFWKGGKVPGLPAKLADALAALPGRNHGIPLPLSAF